MQYDQICFDVRGVPAAKGSPHARVHNGNVVMHEGKKTKSWERLVRETVAVDLFDGDKPTAPLFVEVPLRVALIFRLTRPSGHWGKKGLKASAAPRPHKKPDIDKLARSTLDPMIGSVFDDDSRIVELVVQKLYADPGDEGVTVRVELWRPAEVIHEDENVKVTVQPLRLIP